MCYSESAWMQRDNTITCKVPNAAREETILWNLFPWSVWTYQFPLASSSNHPQDVLFHSYQRCSFCWILCEERYFFRKLEHSVDTSIRYLSNGRRGRWRKQRNHRICILLWASKAQNQGLILTFDASKVQLSHRCGLSSVKLEPLAKSKRCEHANWIHQSKDIYTPWKQMEMIENPFPTAIFRVEYR